MTDPAILRPGFADPVQHAQQSFRLILEAMSRPGRLTEMTCPLEPPPPFEPATAATALTLFDSDTKIWLDETARSDEVSAFLRFHCGCPLTDTPGEADFAVCLEWPEDFGRFAQGEPEYPDRSTTVVVQLDSLGNAGGLLLSGPGIAETARLDLSPCPSDFAARWSANRARFPLGVDLILTADRAFCGLPRSLTVAED
ncbi:phosphonate C-P lyase system protein PhnH [Algihabitans albus]|uniref:phosphonate C-P lyase system protein PhnH n=1 Tax=Algihabitans albus TaxID=2164067 RepID=UPI001ABC4537|nr:phosphonate C-P lyase system protein PhnH [Algihabitans albus]